MPLPTPQSSGFARGICLAHGLHTAASCVMSSLSGGLPHSPEKLQWFYHKLSEHRAPSGKPIRLTTVPGDRPAASTRLTGPKPDSVQPSSLTSLSSEICQGNTLTGHSRRSPLRGPHRPRPSQGQDDGLVAEPYDQAEAGPGICMAQGGSWGEGWLWGHQGLPWLPGFIWGQET